MAGNKEKQIQDIYMQYQMIDQHVKQMQQQLEMITSQLLELASTKNGLDEFSKIKSDKEILVPLSSGIFARASIKRSDELLVNVGSNIVVKKDVPSTKKLVEQQIEEIKKVQRQTLEELEKMTSHAAQLEMHLQKVASQ